MDHLKGIPFAADTKSQKSEKGFVCNGCGRSYKHNRNLQAHVKYECGKEPQFPCPWCPYKAKLRGTLRTHVALKHKESAYQSVTNNLYGLPMRSDDPV
jgi:hypothetical protein